MTFAKGQVFSQVMCIADGFLKWSAGSLIAYRGKEFNLLESHTIQYS